MREAEFFVTGGALASDARSYVVRGADAELVEALSAGEFCYVLTARQMGKSSLMVRAVGELRKRGIDAAVVDLTAIGLHVTVDQWYRGLLSEIGEHLGIEAAIDDAWSALRDLPATQRWLKILRELLVRRERPLAIFIDEIDVVRSLPFRTDDFFAGIREIFNRRARDPAMRRLSFCLLGVAAPSDLIADPTLTPFNIGRRIELADFTPTESLVLADGLGRPHAVARALLERIVYWTGAHPYLTQRLCQTIARDATATDERDVDRWCHELFLSPHAAERDDNLIFVREHLLTQDALRTPLLDLYASVLRNGVRAGDDRINPVVSALRLSGIVRADGDRLRVRNEIYARVFDRRWVARHLPDAEIRRQRAAYWRGVFGTAAAAAIVVALALAGVGLLWRQQRLLRAEQERSRRVLYAAEMNLAAQAWDASGAARTRGLLEHHIPAADDTDLRGFEWRYLWRLTHGDDPPLHGRVQDPTRVAFTPDGTRLAVAGWGGLVDMWDLAARRLLFTIGNDREHRGQTALTFSPDGRTLVTGGSLAWVHVYDALTGRMLQDLRGHTDRLRDAAFSPDGRLLATAGLDRTIRVWNTSTWQPIATYTGHTRGINAVRFSADGSRLISASWDNTVRVWDVRDGREVGRLPHDGDVETLALTRKGHLLVTAGWEQALKIWDTVSSRVAATLPGHTTVVADVFASPDARTIVSASRDGTVRLWDLDQRREVSRVRTSGRRYLTIALSPDGRRLVTAGDDGELRLWPVEPSGRVDQDATVLEGHTDVVTGLAFTPDDRRLISSSYDATARVWDWKGRTATATLQQHGRIGLAPSMSPDGRLVAIKDDERSVAVWDVAAARLVRELPPAPPLTGAVFTRDGRLVVCDNFVLQLWDLARDTPVVTMNTSVNVGPNLAISPDGSTLISGNRQGEVSFWSLSPLSLLATAAPHTDYVSAFDFSPDGQTMLTASFDGVVRLWDWRTRTPRAELRGHQGWVTSAVFSPDGRRVVSGGADGVIKFWDVETGHELMTLRGHGDRIHALAFTHDGQVLASASADRTIRLWRAAASIPYR